MNERRTIAVPSAFLIDHMERDRPTPEILKQDARLCRVYADDPAWADLLDDARHYVDGVDMAGTLPRSAMALLASYERQLAGAK